MNLPYSCTPEMELMRHCASTLLAYVVSEQFPESVFVGGGINSVGFYCDFIFKQPLFPSLFELLEVQLRTLIKEERELTSLSMMRENAQEFFEHRKLPLMALCAEEKEENVVDLVKIDNFYGFCPPLPFRDTSGSGHVKLLGMELLTRDISGKKVTVTRLLGTVQKSFSDLKVFSKSYDLLLKKKDHRVLGSELKLFSLPKDRALSMPVWFPKGVRLRALISEWVSGLLPAPEFSILTPQVIEENGDDAAPGEESYRLIESSVPGHLAFFKEGSFGSDELPVRVNETLLLHSAFPESEKWGLFCTPCYYSTVSTIGCLKNQLLQELISSLHFIEQIITIFAFEAHWVLVVSGRKSPRARKEQESVDRLKEAIRLSSSAFPFQEEPEESKSEIEGPTLELRVRDQIGRDWTVSSIKVPVHGVPAFSLSDEEAVGKNKPVMLTRCMWSSLDRFIALLIEHYEGKLPLWLAPEQVRILVIGKANETYAKQVKLRMEQKGLRVKLDLRSGNLSAGVREAEKEKIPYLVLIGEQEVNKKGISVRSIQRTYKDQFVELDPFLDKIYRESLNPKIHREQCQEESVN